MLEIKEREEDATEYVPDFRNNRDLAEDPDGKPFVVEILPLSGADYDKMYRRAFGNSKKSGQFIKKGEELVKRIIAERVVSVRDLTLTAPGGRSKPSTGAELHDAVMRADASCGAIIDDIVNAIKDASVLEEGTLGKLRRPSDSFEPAAQSQTSTESGLAQGVAVTSGVTQMRSTLPSVKATYTDTSETAPETPQPISSSDGILS